MASATDKAKAENDALDRILARTIMHTNRENQEAYVGRKLPGDSGKLIAVAEEAGWEVRSGWSLVLVPAGWRESTSHRRAKTAHFVEFFGVQARAYGANASAVWKIVGGSASFDEGYMLTKSRGMEPMGVTALMAYMKGE